jgi:bisphosphoglycerate-independent phosphoglycerate mutase (AlkP superfamily)
MGTLQAEQCTIIVKFRSIRLRKVSHRMTENKKKHFTCNNPPPENRVVYETMWKNVLQPEATDKIAGRTHFAGRITEARIHTLNNI